MVGYAFGDRMAILDEATADPDDLCLGLAATLGSILFVAIGVTSVAPRGAAVV